MRKMHLALLTALIFSGAAFGQTGTVKALQPGLLEVAGPRVNEVQAAGIQKITATPGKGSRAIAVESPWGFSYFAYPKDVKPLAFTIVVGKPAGTATISAPGFNEGNKADYRAAIEAIIPFAVRWTNDIHKLATQ